VEERLYPFSALEFEVPLFGSRVVCVTSLEDYNAIRDSLGVDPIEGHSVGMTSMYQQSDTGATLYAVMVRDSKPSTLVHELCHLTHRILERAGVKDEETFCYLLDWLYTRCGGDNV
jgi:hypothetical protein